MGRQEFFLFRARILRNSKSNPNLNPNPNPNLYPNPHRNRKLKLDSIAAERSGAQSEDRYYNIYNLYFTNTLRVLYVNHLLWCEDIPKSFCDLVLEQGVLDRDEAGQLVINLAWFLEDARNLPILDSRDGTVVPINNSIF